MISLYNDISTLNYDTLFCFEFELHNSTAITDDSFWKLIHDTLVTSLSSTWELKLIHAMWNQRCVALTVKTYSHGAITSLAGSLDVPLKVIFG